MKGLSEAGYAKTSFKQKPLQTVIESGKGVYQLKHVKTQHGLSSMAGVSRFVCYCKIVVQVLFVVVLTKHLFFEKPFQFH